MNVDEYGAALPRRHVERERIPLLANDWIDVGYQSVRPDARGAIAARRHRDVDQCLAVERHVAAGDAVAAAVADALQAHRHAACRTGHDDLKRFELVPRRAGPRPPARLPRL